MKVIIPSKGRPETITTHNLFSEHEYIIVLHNEEEKVKYLNNPTISPDNVVVSGVPYGISFQRQWIVNNLIPAGQWFLTADDNIKEITKLAGQKNVALSKNEFWREVQETLNKAEAIGANYCGFSVVDNYYFRVRKWRYVGYVISKLALIKNMNLQYDPKILAMDDYGFTAENLLKFGKVLINNSVFPIAQHYQEGGIGTREERLEKKIHDCQYLMDKYPRLFRYKRKAGWPPKAEIQIRFSNLRQVQEWRKEMVAGGKNGH